MADEMTAEQLKAALAQERAARVQRVSQAINALLQTERCRIVPVVTITDRGVQTQVQVVAEE